MSHAPSTASCSAPTIARAGASCSPASRAPRCCWTLPKPIALRDGDGLVLDDGSIVQVVGAPEPLVEVCAHSALDVVRLAWHLGNRHTDVQIVGEHIRIRRDHVLEDMLRRLGAHLTRLEAPFDPEQGAPQGHHEHRHGDDNRDVPQRRSSPRKRGPSAAAPDVLDTRLRANEREKFASSALYRLMAWLSPAFPVGAFSYSSGIEWAVEAGDIKDADTLRVWLSVMLAEGGGYCDAVLFAHAHRAVGEGDDRALRAVAELAAAFAPSKERHLETTAQGNAFIEATRAAWPCAALDRLKAVWDGPVAYPVAVAVAAAGHGIALAPALAAYLQAVAANWVSAGVRLVPLGQTGGQRVLAALEPAVAATAARALAAQLDDIGSAAFRADLASARHETQYTRLFRS